MSSQKRFVYMVRKGEMFYRNHASGMITWDSILTGQVFHQRSGASRAANLTGGEVLEFELDARTAVIR